MTMIPDERQKGLNEAFEMFPQWISIEDVKPIRFTRVLTYYQIDTDVHIIECVTVLNPYDPEHDSYTHWQPLPPPPTN